MIERLTHDRMIMIQIAITQKPRTKAELAAMTGCSMRSINDYIEKLRAVPMVYIGAWGNSRRGRKVTPLFSWGSEPDVERPAALTAAQRMARTRANRRKVT